MKNTSYVYNENRNIGNLIHTTNKKISEAYNKKLKEFELTFPQALAILLIDTHPDQEVYQKNLEQWMNLTNPSVTSLVKSMISKDLMYRIQSKQDARYFHLHLTPKGLELAKIIPDSLTSVDEQILSPLSQEEQKTLTALLNKLNAEL